MLSVMDNIVNIRYKRHNSDNSAKKEKKRRRNAACILLYPTFNALEYIDDEKLLEMMTF